MYRPVVGVESRVACTLDVENVCNGKRIRACEQLATWIVLVLEICLIVAAREYPVRQTDVPGRGHRPRIDSVGIATGDLIAHIVLVVLKFMVVLSLTSTVVIGCTTATREGLRAEASEREMPRACDADDDEFRRGFASVLVGGRGSIRALQPDQRMSSNTFLPLPAPQTLSAPSDIYPRPTFRTINALTKDLLLNKPLSSPKTTKKLIPNKLSKMGALDVVPVSCRLG